MLSTDHARRKTSSVAPSRVGLAARAPELQWSSSDVVRKKVRDAATSTVGSHDTALSAIVVVAVVVVMMAPPDRYDHASSER